MGWGTNKWGPTSWGTDAVPVTSGIINDKNGNPLTNGYIDFYLSTDATYSSGGATNFIPGGVKVRITLDPTGRVSANQSLMANDVMTPNNVVYLAKVFKSTGALAYRFPQTVVVTGLSFDLSTVTFN